MNIDENMYGMCARLMGVEGQLRFLKDWDTELSTALVEWKNRPAVFVQLPSEPVYRLRVVHIPPSMTRKFDYDTLAADRRDLYTQHVVEIPAAVPYRLRFGTLSGYGASREWNALKAAAWERVKEQNPQRYRAVSSADAAAQQLKKVRWSMRAATEKREALRADIAARVHADQLRLSGRGDGLIVATPAVPRRSIDLDMAEGDDVLSNYLTKSRRAAHWKVWFQEVTPGDEDYENPDDPGIYSTDYTKRLTDRATKNSAELWKKSGL